MSQELNHEHQHSEECGHTHDNHAHLHNEEPNHAHEHHEDGCNCGHEHHDHQEQCSCGKEYHHNGDQCDCENEHHHHEDGCTCSSCSGEVKDGHINVYTHDAAIVGSIKCKIEKPYDESEQILDSCMKEIAHAVNENNGIIGHIKAFMVAEGDSCMISITDEESSKRHMKGQYVNVEGVAIVFGIETTKLHDILEKALNNLKSK